MTIAAAYLVSDGVVLGADSSTTVQISNPQGGSGIVQLLTHSQKVFEVGSNARFGICTWGAGNIGKWSHRTIIARLSDQMNEKSTVEDAAKGLVEIVLPLVKETGTDFIGYYLGGWNPENHEPACIKVEISQSGDKIEPLTLGLCSFSGNPIFFGRVFRGFDVRLPETLKNKLRDKINSTEDFDNIFNNAFEEITRPLATIGYKDLPIREAIDFIYSYLHITVKAEKFKFGAPSCGGPIEVGFISTDRTFRWVKHKPFFSAMEEQEGEYYE